MDRNLGALSVAEGGALIIHSAEKILFRGKQYILQKGVRLNIQVHQCLAFTL